MGRKKLSKKQKDRNAYKRWVAKTKVMMKQGGPNEWCSETNKKKKSRNGYGVTKVTKCDVYRKSAKTRLSKKKLSKSEQKQARKLIREIFKSKPIVLSHIKKKVLGDKNVNLEGGY